MKARVFAVLAVLALLIGGGWLLLRNQFEWVEDEIWVGYSGDARFNHFLAAERLLERMGLKTSALRSLPSGKQMPGPRDVLILPARHLKLTPGQVKELVSWVEEGGLLITEGTYSESADAERTEDLLLDAFGTRMIRSSMPEAPNYDWENQEAAENKRKEFEALKKKHETLSIQFGERSLTVELDASLALQDRKQEAAERATGDYGIRMLRFDRGEGSAIVLTSLSCLNNWTIEKHDHADFLWALVRDWGHDNQAWIVYREEPPSLWRWLRDHAWTVMIACLVVALIALWRARLRFGPMLPDPPTERRSLLEHLQAVGRFHWKHRDATALLKAAREATLAQVQRIHPAWLGGDPNELSKQLASVSGLDEERVFRALRFDRLGDSTDFVEAIQTLDLVRKSL
jgi:hypothetical protein